MALEDINPSFRMDTSVAPVWKCENYNIEDKTFEVYYNDGTLNNDEWYGPIYMDLDALEPENVNPLRFQIADAVAARVTYEQCRETDMSQSILYLNSILGQEQSVSQEELMAHHEAMVKNDPQYVDPNSLTATQVVNVYSEDDFDEQFEALSAALNSEE